jgi:PAS domain S-box-containing protein
MEACVMTEDASRVSLADSIPGVPTQQFDAGASHEFAVEDATRLVVDSIPGLVALLTSGGEVQFANHHILEYTGQTLEELKGWGTNGTVHPEDLPHVVDVFTRSIGSGNPYEIVQRLRRSDGAYRWFQNNGFPLRDASGRIVRWCVLLTDVDDRKRTEDALRESEHESRLIVDSIPGLIAAFTPGGEVEFVNRQILEYFGRTVEDLKRWGTGSTTHPEDLPRVVELFTQAVAFGDPFEFEVRARRFDGVYRWFQSRGFPLRDMNGQIVRWYNLLIDIDERKRAEEALRESERESRLIVDSIPGLVAILTPAGEMVGVNNRVVEYCGRPLAELKQWATNDTLHPEDRPRIIQLFAETITSGLPSEWEARIRRFDGAYRWFQFRGLPLHETSGRIVRWYVLLTDIDDLKRAEAELRRAYDHLTEAQRLSQTGSFTADLERDEHYWSDEFYRICDFEPGSTVTIRRLGEIVHPEDAPLYEGAIGRAMAGTDPDFYFRIVTSRGVIKHLRGFAHRIADRPVFVGAVQDVTASKMAQEALNRAGAELAHVSRATSLSALTASIAHEVNQPLSGIITNAGTCLRMLDATPPNIEGARETALRTIRDGNRASDVIARLRALFTKREFALEPLDLNEATREVIALSSNDFQRNRIILRSELADDLPTVTGDRIQLQQVMLNLLRNASDAMVDVHDRPRYLLIKTEREEGDRVRLTVRDAGMGLPPQSLNSLFDAFYTTKHGGMGIGLFVSRSIVERHQGRLWAEPNDGPGATFSFSIPRAPQGTMD